MTDTLPPLPDAAFTYERQPGGFSEPQRVPAFTAAQMESYARAALAAVPAQPNVCRVIAKGGKFTRGLYESPTADMLTAWDFDGDTVQWLTPSAAPQAVPVPSELTDDDLKTLRHNWPVEPPK